MLDRKGQMLYDGVVALIAEHMGEVGKQVAEVHTDELLSAARAQWDLQRVVLKNTCDILMYLVGPLPPTRSHCRSHAHSHSHSSVRRSPAGRRTTSCSRSTGSACETLVSASSMRRWCATKT